MAEGRSNQAICGLTGEMNGLDAKTWFAATTARIDRLKTVEDQLARDLAALAIRISNDADAALMKKPVAQLTDDDILNSMGDPALMIERMAEKGGYDTIVIGTRDLGSIDRMLQGSVSEHVATHASATVVIAR